MKRLLKCLLLTSLIFVPLIAGAKDEVKFTPKKHYPLGYVGDKGWLKGAKVFENTPKFKAVPILEEADLSKYLPPKDNQTTLGSCTGFGLAHGVYASLKKAYGKSPIFSPLFIYYNERMKEGNIYEDSGAQIMTGILTLKEFGAATECKWPYKTEKFAIKPSAEAYEDALKHTVINAYRVNNRDGVSIKRANSAGYCVVFGMLLGEEFEMLNKNQYVYHGRKSSRDLIGGHCTIQYGYNKNGDYLCRNQWDEKVWGNKNDFIVVKAVMESKDVSDCWVIESVKQ